MQQYYPVFYEYTPRIYTGNPKTYGMSKGEENTINIWSAILRYEEYDLLADLFILGFMHDTIKDVSRGCPAYTLDEMSLFMDKAANILAENEYSRYNPRCKTYLTLGASKLFYQYCVDIKKGSLTINNTEEFAEAMMKIITDAYNSKYFIIRYPSEQSVRYARNVQQRATDRLFDYVLNDQTPESEW